MFRTTVTRSPKKAVVMARTWPLRRRTRMPRRYEAKPAKSPPSQNVHQKERPKRVLAKAAA